MFGENTELLSQLYNWLALAVFICMPPPGGHVAFMGAMVGSFQRVPLLGLVADRSVFDLALGVMEQVFVIAVKVAAPALVALTLASVAMGFIARTVPQMNILVVGFPLRVALGLLVTATALMGAAYLFEDFFAAIGGVVDHLMTLLGAKG
jgi:flagellar biosynthetic protein FliR